MCVSFSVRVCDHLTPPGSRDVKGHIPNTSSLFFLPLLIKHWLRGPQFREDNEHRSIKRGDNKARCDRGQHLGAASHINETRRRTERKRLREGKRLKPPSVQLLCIKKNFSFNFYRVHKWLHECRISGNLTCS